MPVHQVHAYAFAATFKLKELVPLFTVEGREPKMKERLLSNLGNDCYALAYDFGSVVFVNCSAHEQVRIIDELRRRLPPEPHPPLNESFIIETGVSSATEVRFDRVIVPELSEGVIDIVALILAQSVSMDYYAQDVEQIEEQTDRFTHGLQTSGRIGPVKPLIRFIGSCIATRNDILSTLALFDKPDATWENEALDRLWEGLYRMLELDDRYKALEAKLHMFQDNLEVLVDLTRQSQTIRLEVAVVVLIMLETVVMLWQIFRGIH